MGYVCCSEIRSNMGQTFCCADRDDSRVQGITVYKRQVAEEALGAYTFASMWGYKQACYDALRAAEAKYGRPVYAIEVSQNWQSTLVPKIGTAEIYAGLLDLYKADECLSDGELTKFTLELRAQSVQKRKTVFELYSDRMWHLYPSY